jgi:hypothetical protein
MGANLRAYNRTIDPPASRRSAARNVRSLGMSIVRRAPFLVAEISTSSSSSAVGFSATRIASTGVSRLVFPQAQGAHLTGRAIPDDQSAHLSSTAFQISKL